MSEETHSTIEGWQGKDGRIRVRARKPCTVGLVDLAIGQEIVAMRHEVARLLKHRMVEEIEAVEDEAAQAATPAPRRGRRQRNESAE